MFSRHTWIADALVLAVLIRVASALWLSYGAAALLVYIGAVCIVVGIGLVTERRAR